MSLIEFVKANLADMKIRPWQERLLEMLEDNQRLVNPPPMFIGVDWAKDSGMNRGEVYNRQGNITWVRFKTVELEGR